MSNKIRLQLCYATSRGLIMLAISLGNESFHVSSMFGTVITVQVTLQTQDERRVCSASDNE